MLVYLHIPFCDSKCYYCSFNSYTNISNLKTKYMHSIAKQLKYEIKRANIKKIDTLFIGGGTPSTIEPKYYEEFFKIIEKYLLKNTEITTEANPNSATNSWLDGMRSFGINRISFGVQSFDKEKLKYLGRNHTPKIAINAIEKAYKLGIKNISLDIIHNTKIDNKRLLKKDIDIAFSLPINHISTYSLSIEKGALFAKKKEKAKEDIALQKWLYNKILDRGFERYEISNFGKYRSKHNLGYWKHKEYIGIGAGAVGYINKTRYYPNKDVKEYINDPLCFKKEKLTREQIKMEKIFLGLRSIVGFDIDILNNKEKERVKLLIKEKKVIQKDSRILNTDFMLSDEIALFILS